MAVIDNMRNMVKASADRVKSTAQSLGDNVKGQAARLKATKVGAEAAQTPGAFKAAASNFFTAASSTAKSLGGVFASVGRAGVNTAGSVLAKGNAAVNAGLRTTANMYSRSPKLMILGTAVGAYLAAKSWLTHRGQMSELKQLRAANAMAEAQVGANPFNDTLAARRAAAASFDNAGTTDHVATLQQQAAAAQGMTR